MKRKEIFFFLFLLIIVPFFSPKITFALEGAQVAYSSPDEVLCKNANLRAMGPSFVCITSKKVKFQLITRTYSGYEVWKDIKLNLFISAISNLRYHFESAQNQCQSASTLEFRGGSSLNSISWHLPSGYPARLNSTHDFSVEDSEFEALDADGFNEVVPFIFNRIWSSNLDPEHKNDAFFYIGSVGTIFHSNQNYLYPILCVGR